ncbi:MAG: ATP-binding protein, partial [Geitlerinemataceae cyanobacterium]
FAFWKNLKYSEIGETEKKAESLRKTGASLCKRIEEEFNVKISKKTFRTTIEDLWRQDRERAISPEITHKEVTQKPTAAPILESISPSTLDRETLPLGNPFIPPTGAIDDPHLFFNRKQEIQRIFEFLESGSSVSLTGDRQIGKSSLLKALERQTDRLNQIGRQPIYLNLQLVENEEDFYHYLCDEIGIDFSKGYSLTRSLRDCRLLLLIDEVEKMAGDGFTHEVRDRLRGLAEGRDAPFRLVMATCTPLDKLFEEGKTSPLYNICIEQRLKPWDENTSRAFIDSRLASTDVRFSEEEIAALIAETGGHPQKLMEMCHNLYGERSKSSE